MSRARATTWTVLLASIIGAACGSDDSNDAAAVGTVLEQRTLDVGGSDVDVTLRKGASGVTRVMVPATAVPRRQQVTVRVSSGVMRKGAVVPNDAVFQVATKGVTFSVATPARIQQRVPEPPPTKHYAAVTEVGDAWVVRGAVKVVSDDAGAPAPLAAAPVTLVAEINVYGSGLWAVALVDDVPDGGVPDGSVPDAGVDSGGAGHDAGVGASLDGAVIAADGAVANADGSSTGDDAAPLPPATLIRILPAGGSAATATSIAISGSGFVPGAQIYFDGHPVTTTPIDGGLQGDIPAALTASPGQLAVWVDNRPGDSRTRSNTLYYTVAPVPGAPVVLDYSPDNAMPGDKVLIVATNLMGQTVTVSDSAGHTVDVGATASVNWVGQSADTIEFVVPATFVTGPIIVGNPLGTFRGKTFHVGVNLTRLPGTVLTSSTEYNTGNWSRASGADNDLRTSFFTAHGDCASLPSCTTKPFYQVTFPQPQTVGRIAMRGNREYASGYDFLRGRFDVLNADGIALWSQSYDLPAPDRDLDIFLPAPIAGAAAVRFTSEADESDEPGFSELEVFAP